MRLPSSICYLALFLGVVSVTAEQPAIDVKIEPKASAPLQLAYAKTLLSQIRVARASRDRHAAVANAAFNFMAVEHEWPKDRAAVREAKACLPMVYVEGEMPRNALEAAEDALREFEGDHRSHYARGWALERFGRVMEAASEYEKAVQTFDWNHGGFENTRICVRLTYFFEQAKRYDLAAKILRKHTGQPGLAPTGRVNLALQVIEQLERGGGPIPKQDVENLREAHRMSLAMTLLPAQRAMITRAEEKLQQLDASAR